MPTLAEILTANGLKVEAVSTGRTIPESVRKVYASLTNGAESVYLFAQSASDDMLAAFADAEEVIEGSVIVLQATEDDDVATLRRKVDYRNVRNVNAKTNEPRAKLTLGAIALRENVNDGDGNAQGFRVTAA